MTDKLDEMIAEAGGPVAVENGGAVAAAPVAAGVPALPDYVKGLTGSLVTVGGAIICDRARVTRLEPAEVETLSGAVNNLLRFYLAVDGLDEKAVAWLSLGAVALSVAGNRRRLDPPKLIEAGEGAPPPDLASDAEIVAAQMGAVDALVGAGGATAGA